MEHLGKVMGLGYAVTAVGGILIGAAFGRVWLNLLANGFPEWRHHIEIAGWVVLALFIVVGALVIRRLFRVPLYWNGQLPVRGWYVWFVVLIIVEITLIALGNSFFQEKNLVEWKPAWILIIVGTHFFAFAYIFRIRSFNWLAISMCSTSSISVLMSMFFKTEYLLYILTGLSGMLSLWSFTGWALYRMAQGNWIDVN